MINATPLAADANSYVTLIEAEAYFVTRLYTEAWDGASAPDKEKALLMACRTLDSSFSYVGSPYTNEQALRWPRVGAVTSDGRILEYTTIPMRVKEAQCELALSLLSRDRTAEAELLGLGISQAKVGPIDVKISGDTGTVDVITDPVLLALGELGVLIGGGSKNRIHVVDLTRV